MANSINDFPPTEEVSRADLAKLVVEYMATFTIGDMDYLIEHTPAGDTMALFVSMASCLQDRETNMHAKAHLTKIIDDGMTAANMLEQLEIPEGIISEGEIGLALDAAVNAAKTAACEAEIALEELA